MLGAFFLSATIVTPQPASTPLPTIVHLRASPLCSTLGSSVIHTIDGLRINDRLIANSQPLLLQMGRDYVAGSSAGKTFDRAQAQWGNTAGGVHDPSPGLEMDTQSLYRVSSAIVHNLDAIDGMLKDGARFPADPKTSDDREAQKLKNELQAVADSQRQNLNVLYGLADTYSLQALIAKGDGTLGAINDGGHVQVSHNDQDVSFQDVVTGPERGRTGHATDPGLNQNPAVTQAATDLANNPMARFYLAVAQNQQATQKAEAALVQTVMVDVKSCRP